MNNKLINNMLNNGYTTIINCIDKKIIKEAQENINNTLKKLLVLKKLLDSIYVLLFLELY